MTLRSLFDRRSGDRLLEVITGSLDLRFDFPAERLAARIRQLAADAGMSAADYAARAHLDDLYLASACAADEAAAWTECETRHFPFLRSFAQRMLPDIAARDLAAQVIADLWEKRKIDRYSGRSSLRTWLGAVVAHAAHNARRSLAPAPPVAAAAAAMRVLTADEESPEARETQRVLGQLLSSAVLQLPADEKLLLRLYYE